MTATEALERRIDELCRENERLRQDNQSIGMAAYELGRASLADENAKLRGARDVWQENDAMLRELVRDMHKALSSLNLDHCQACPREDACVFMHRSFDCDECAFERDMRKLGIEVDE